MRKELVSFAAHTPGDGQEKSFQFDFVVKSYVYMEEIIKRKIITGYADRSLQDIYNFINGAQMENLITSKDASSLMSWAEDYRSSR